MNELYNELEKAKSIRENGITIINNRELILFGKYLRQYENLGAKRIKDEIIKLCLGVDVYFNSVLKRSMLDFIVRKAMEDKPITNVSSADIYAEEIAKIQTIKDFKKQCLLLAMLFIVKVKKNSSKRLFINYKDISLAIKISKCGFSKKEFDEELIQEFYKEGMTIYSQKYNTFELLYGVETGDISFSFLIGDDIKEKYKKYCGGEIGYCECGNEFIKTSNRKTNCNICYKKYRLDYKAKNEKNRYNKNLDR